MTGVAAQVCRWPAVLRAACVAGLSVLTSVGAAVAEPAADPPDYALSEEVGLIPASGGGVADLEVTLFRPRGPGPFPLAVLNHGRSPSPAQVQPRFRPLHVAYEFVRRGYAVVVPMRQGFARSGGRDQAGDCDVVADARHQARSIRHAVDWAARQPWADATRSVVIGQSHGGLAALAYAENPHPGTQLVVNFAGGVRKPACADWEASLVDAIAELGLGARLPSLWFYGDNDSHFAPRVWRAAHQRHVSNGGRALLAAFGTFGDDAHRLFGARDGVRVWMPPLLEQLAAAGLPTRIDARHDPLPDVAVGPPLRKVDAGEANQLPIRGRSAREGFIAWLGSQGPRAFVISSDLRHWASAWGSLRPVQRALERCERLSGARCRVYAVDDDVVWPGDSGLH